MSLNKSAIEFTGTRGDEQFRGALDKEGTRRTIREHLAEFRSCYEMKLNRNQTLDGKLVVFWQILEDGSSSKVKVLEARSSLKDKDVYRCCENIIKSMRFPRPPTGVIGEVQFPFVFTSR